jgi:hypothetical protein
MPRLVADVTAWKTMHIDVRMREGCPLYDKDNEDGVECHHPQWSLLIPPPHPCKMSDDDLKDECPLRNCSVVLTRSPEWMRKAVQDALYDPRRPQ